MRKIFISFIFVLFVVVISSCGGDEYSCSTGGDCPNTGGTWEACCTSTDCYYKIGSKKINCDGTTCDSAAQELQIYCYASGATEDNFLSIIDELQEEIAE